MLLFLYFGIKEKEELKVYITALSALRESLLQTKYDQESKQEIEWAFFEKFHEGTVGGMYEGDLGADLQQRISLSSLEDSGILEDELNYYKNYSERAQEEIDMARSLRLTTENVDQKTEEDIRKYVSKNTESDLDFVEARKYISAHLHLIEGYKKLKEHASVFDVLNRNEE